MPAAPATTVSKKIEDHETRIRGVETDVIILKGDVFDEDTGLAKTRKELKEMYDMVLEMRFTVRIVSWVGAAFGASVIALIWSIITHKVTLGF